jgi:hypothetical protein
MSHGNDLIPQMSARRHKGMVFLARDRAETALCRNADTGITRADRPFSKHIARGRSGEDGRQEEVGGL